MSQGIWAVQLCKHPTWTGYVGKSGCSLGFETSKATRIQLWVLEAGNNGAAGNNERSCQAELRKRHSDAGQRGIQHGAGGKAEDGPQKCLVTVLSRDK